MARDRNSLKETTTLIKKEANKRDIYINEYKTKYMTVERGRKQVKVREMQIGNYKFETADIFKYLGVMINNRNDRGRETEHRIQACNRTFYKYKSVRKSKEINRKTKMKVYKVATRPAVTYGVETMILIKDEGEKLRRFEKKIMRKIYGPKESR